MSDIIAAADQSAATTLLHDAETTLGTLHQGGGSTFGPFFANYGADVSFSGGTVDLIPPDTIQLNHCNVNYALNLSFGLDLDQFLPHFCIPRICFWGWCTPRFCVSWPTITVPVHFSDSLTITGDFTVAAALSGPNWLVNVTIQSVPLLQFGLATGALLTAIGVAIALAVGWVPLIGPFIALLAPAVLATIGAAGVIGLLGQIITPFISGLTFNVYKQPRLFPVLPATGPNDPKVDIKITALAAAVQATDKNELVLTASIAA